MFEIVLFGIISRILYDREKKLQIQLLCIIKHSTVPEMRVKGIVTQNSPYELSTIYTLCSL